MLKEFKEFALRGNVIDLAVGIIIGGAFQKIVTSLVNDLIMPGISIFTGNVDYSNLSLQIGNSSIKYGNFLSTIIDFLIIAISIFLLVKYINKLNRKLEEIKENEMKKLKRKIGLKGKDEEDLEEEVEPETKTCPHCLSEIKYKATRCPNCTSELEKTDENVENE
ncbi:MAG: large conductance mechanosensitive channel protein MscL [Lachnospiraceae bacterium]|jgi:large conductance mechanosensitive channel|nr:large conductance mechanosensitive channel protein MscL [Lachnospiraceae bacterium]